MELPASTPDTLSPHLTELYGADAAARVLPRLAKRLARFANRTDGATAVPDTNLDQSHSLLITYGDQVLDGARASLAVLHEFARRHLRGVVSGIHILPFYPYTSDDGFSVTDYFAVNPDLGTWDDVAALGREFDLMFDAVFNHMSAQGDWFRRFLAGDPEFDDFFVTVTGTPDLSNVVRPRALPLLTEFPAASGPVKVWTTFSADQVDVDARNPEVMLKLMDALLFYVERGARFIRLDAIAYLWKEIGTPCIHLPQTHRFIQLMRAVLDAVAPQVKLITETNVPHRDNISYFGNGTNEAHLVYNFALPPLTFHALLTGDASYLTGWARTLALPSPHTAFFNFLASHDGIGVNPARGILPQAEIDRLVARATEAGGYVSYKHNPDGSKSPYELNINYYDALSGGDSPDDDALALARFRCAHAIQCALAGMPGIYFHSLFGSRNDRAGAEHSGIPRRINREKLRLDALDASLADPASRRARVFASLAELLRVRAATPAFHPGATQDILDLDPRVFALRRTALDGSATVLALHNVSNETVELTLPDAGPWQNLFTGQTGSVANASTASTGTTLALAPYDIRWLQMD